MMDNHQFYPSYQAFRNYFYYLTKLDLIEKVRTLKSGKRPHLIKNYYDIVESRIEDRGWKDPQGELYHLSHPKKLDMTNIGCIMLEPSNIINFENLIDKEDLYDDGSGEYGLSEYAHITLLFGVHDDKDIKKKSIEIIKKMPSMTLKSKRISIFESNDYDVVKFDIEPTNDLLLMRKKVMEELPNTQTYQDYHPHMTIGYVKKGHGKKYIKDFKKPLLINFDVGIYSDVDYNKTRINLR